MDMDAHIPENSSSATSPELREGERVEVRQKDKGLRGSWHLATIVGLKPGRCLVEYDELLSDDGLCKLRESIPVTKCLHKSSFPPSISSPQVNTASSSAMQSPASSRKRGFLRPAPPLLTEPVPFSWKGGLFVDVFFQDAWWEAVLLDDVVSLEEDAYVNVIYPDEGDLAQVRVKDLRISQLWDEVTGAWSMKGSCNLTSFLKRRGISRKEAMPTTSTDFERSQVDLHQISSAERKSKLYERVCSIFDVVQGGSTAGTALLQDMTYYVQGAARASVRVGEECSGQQPDSFSSDKIIGQEPQQSTCPKNGKVDIPSFASDSNNLVECTGFSCRNEMAGYEGRECINDDAKPCIDGSQSKEVGLPVFERETTELCSESLSTKEVGMPVFERETTESCIETLSAKGVEKETTELCIETPSSMEKILCGLETQRNPKKLVEATGFPCRNEAAGYEGPECINDDAKSGIDGSQSKEFGMPVVERETTESCIEILTEKEKLINGSETQRINTEIYLSPCGGEGESLVSPSLLPSAQEEVLASSCDNRADSSVSSPLREISGPQKESCVSPCEIEANSSSRPSPAPQEELTIPCREETDAVASTPCLIISSPDSYQHSVCESKHQQSAALMEEFVDGTKGSKSQKSNGGVKLNSCEEEVKTFMYSAYLAMSNSQDHSNPISETKQQELGFGMGQYLERGDAPSRSKTRKKVSVVMHGGNNVQQPVETDTMNYLEEDALVCLDRDCSGEQKRFEKITKLMEPKVDADNEILGCEKKVPVGRTQVDSAEVDGRVKRKGMHVSQERIVRTGLRAKHCDRDSFSDEEIERRLESETLRSFRDRLVLQKQADAMKRKALETRRGLEKGETVEKKKEKSQLLNKLKHTETRRGLEKGGKVKKKKKINDAETAASMANLTSPVVKGKGLKFLTRDIAQKALLEAGFTIDLRPRRTRDYQDAVYVSPEGHSYWSLPKAWDALKKAQAVKSLDSNGQAAGGHEKGTMSSMHREERNQSLAKADKTTLKEVFSRFGNDERLQSALLKLGTCSGTHLEMAQNVTRQAELTNADLTDILLGDLGVLRRFTTKFLANNTLGIINPVDSKAPGSTSIDVFGERRGTKRKRDSACALETSDQKILDGKGFSRKLQGDSSLKSREEKKQGIARCLKQAAAFETKLMDSKQKAKKGKKPKARSGFRLEVRRPSSPGCEEPACHTKRTVFAWMLDRGAVLEREKIFFVDQINKQVLKEGIVTREGILCSCCKRVFTIYSFEAHAGRHSGHWYEALIFTSGKRLLECQLKAWDAEILLRQAHNYVGVTEDDTNDDTCVLCGDGGDLICCDGCPSTFHASCLQIDNIPEGNWYCPKCSCGACGGREHGEKQEDPAVILCNQCEHRYHIACLHGGRSTVGKAVFCRPSCEKIFSSLRGLIGIVHPLGGGFSWTLLRCMEEDKAIQLIRSKAAIDYHSKLAVALLVIKECFNPMVDPRTNIDMITHAMYNRWSEFDRLNYAGFYTAVLEKEGEIISVASIRIHGVRLAEMPLIGTREKYRRQGMCRLLVGVIEKLLCSLEVAFFVLPAIAELFDTWTHAFGFRPLDPCLKSEIKDISMMVFPGTELLQKPLSVSPMRDALVSHEPHSESDCTSSRQSDVSGQRHAISARQTVYQGFL